MKGTRWNDTGGFSLVEVLVALAVTGLVVLGTSGLTSLARDAYERFEHDAAARDQIVAASRIFRDLATGAVPALDVNDPHLATADQLTVKTMGTSIMALDRPSSMTLRVRTRPEGLKSLVISWGDLNADHEREEVIIDGASEISFAYFGAITEQPAAWRSDWKDAGLLPKAISLRVRFPSFGAPVDLIARTFSTFPQVCVALPAEPACKQDAFKADRAWP